MVYNDPADGWEKVVGASEVYMLLSDETERIWGVDAAELSLLG